MLEHMRVFRLTTCLLALATGASLPIGAAAAAPLQPAAIHWDAATSSDLIEVRAAVRRGGAAMGPRGGAVVHRGGAIGFVTAATAAAWAGAAPAPGMCWYYTDPSRTQGFWDYCQ
ncbi:hypothetical protein [Bradyrhizobium sp.]|uniref:hypothetical protein n=1 Tax=Bradyrhizobium sp. TaxID=376 RepID=UPI0007C97869|nr:hypothetical protein [Bradyrhizobium sp.]